MNNYLPIFDLAASLAHQDDFQELLRLISSQTASILNARTAAIVMINPDTGSTVKTIIKGGEADGQQHKLLQTNMIGWVMKHKQPFLSADIATDQRFAAGLFKADEALGGMCVPLTVAGKDIGYIVAIGHQRRNHFDEADLDVLQKLAAVAAPHLSNVQKISDFFQKPIPEAALLQRFSQMGMLGRSKSFVEMLKAIEAASRCDVRVLLEGQSGTGKELVARAIHQGSQRRDFPFIAIDCGAIPEQLIESELFGHKKGAFTGANQDRKGLLEAAHRGTFFMDEIGNLNYDMQAKLLRVLQEGEIRVLGSNQTRAIDVRIISASSKSLRAAVDEGSFREDLFYRLHVYPIEIPPLQHRRKDIPLLAEHFLQKFSAAQDKSLDAFAPELIDFMQQRRWRGNIRELENFVERLVTLAEPHARQITAATLPKDFLKEFKKLELVYDAPDGQTLQAQIADVEAGIIRQALIDNAWNQSKAARALGVAERTIRYKMEKLGIVRPEAD